MFWTRQNRASADCKWRGNSMQYWWASLKYASTLTLSLWRPRAIMAVVFVLVFAVSTCWIFHCLFRSLWRAAHGVLLGLYSRSVVGGPRLFVSSDCRWQSAIHFPANATGRRRYQAPWSACCRSARRSLALMNCPFAGDIVSCKPHSACCAFTCILYATKWAYL